MAVTSDDDLPKASTSALPPSEDEEMASDEDNEKPDDAMDLDGDEEHSIDTLSDLARARRTYDKESRDLANSPWHRLMYGPVLPDSHADSREGSVAAEPSLPAQSVPVTPARSRSSTPQPAGPLFDPPTPPVCFP